MDLVSLRGDAQRVLGAYYRTVRYRHSLWLTARVLLIHSKIELDL